MSRIITALFDTRADADAGAARLHEAGVEAGHVNVHDQSSHTTTGDYSTHEDRGMWASIKSVFVPDRDRHAYEEGVRRGGFLLTAEVADDKTAAAVAALDEANSVDLDARTEEWRAGGWDYADTGSTFVDEDTLSPYATRDAGYESTRYRSYTTMDRSVD